MKKIAFKRILRRHKDCVYNYSLYFLQNHEDAEDVTQEVFVKLWQNWDNIDRNKVKAWLMRVAHNMCIDQVRRGKALATNFNTSAPIDLESLPIKSDMNVDPELYYEFTEMQKALLTALNTLPERTKSMLLLHYFQGLKYEAIGEILNTKVGTIKVAIYRGKKMLRKFIETQFQEIME